jgi:glycosyltransferase involved in cell wall biosynthesis
VVTQGNLEQLKPYCPRAIYLTNPVNMRNFTRTECRAKIACWNGSTYQTTAEGKNIKGIYDIILPACSNADVRLVTAEYHTNRVSRKDMPAWYHRASVYLCASQYEGASNSVMEAMASGLALICTDAGNHREMQESQIEHFGYSGIMIIDLTIGAFENALRYLTPERIDEMGDINRAEIESRWSWEVWRDRYSQFLEMAR